MEAINVIVILSGVIHSVETYLYNSDTIAEVCATAQHNFNCKIISNSDSKMSGEDLEECIENGVYSNGAYEVCLVHSETVAVHEKTERDKMLDKLNSVIISDDLEASLTVLEHARINKPDDAIDYICGIQTVEQFEYVFTPRLLFEFLKN